MHIVSVVPNSAVRDARIVKEARSLAAAGHEVSIVGVMEPAFPSYRTVIDGAIQVHRVPYADTADALKSRLYRLLGIVGTTLAVLLIAFIVFALVLSEPSAVPPTGSSLWSTYFGGWGVAGAIARVLVAILVALWLAGMTYVVARLAMRKPVSPASIGFVADIRSKFFNKINLWARRRAIRQEQSGKIADLAPDIIYCHEAMSLPGCVAAKRALKVPLVYDAHEFYDETEGLNAEVANSFYRKVHSRYIGEVDHFITVSQTIAEMYREKYSQLTQSVTILPNSIVHRQIPAYDGRLHRTARLPETKKILLYQGGISTPRMVHEVVKAAQFLPNDWSVVVMGTGAEKDEIAKLAEKINDSAILRQASTLLTEQQINELKERTLAYFGKIQANREIAGETNSEEAAQSSGAESTGGDRGVDLERYVDNRINTLFDLYARRANQAQEKRRELYLREQLVDKLDSIFWETDQLIELKSQMRSKYWEFARRLAMRDLIAGLEIEFSPRVSMIDAVPQGELLEWTQGATVGVIPYPITSANHWGCAPNKLWEYTGAGVPLISTPSKEISEFIATYGIGWTISADPKAQEIANLAKRLTDEDIAEAREGCARFIAESNWQIHSKNWVAMIDGIRA